MTIGHSFYIVPLLVINTNFAIPSDQLLILGVVCAGFRVVTTITMIWCSCSSVHGVLRIRNQHLRTYTHYPEESTSPIISFLDRAKRALDEKEQEEEEDVREEVSIKLYIYEHFM